MVCVALLVVVMSSCDSWLDLKPIDKVLEDQLYETEEGFKQALTGVESRDVIRGRFDV